jgi:galactonate dehydratase
MKIKDITVHLVSASWRNFIIVKVTADDGVVGYGEATLADFAKTIEAAVLDYRPYLIGREVDVPAITNFLYTNFYWRGGQMLMSAMSAIEQALWDILGRSSSQPVYRMLGGKAVERIRTYANGFLAGSPSPEECATAARKVVKGLGFGAIKFDPFGAAGPRITKEDLNVSLKRIGAVREAVGDDVDIIIEAHGRFDTDTAIWIADELKAYSPFWFEEPVREENMAAMATVRSRSRVTIASGERLVTKYLFNDFLAARAADIIQPDVCHMGGIKAMCDVASMAEASFVSVAPHNPNGPIATAATLNAMMTMPNGLIMEYWIDAETVRRDLVEDYFDMRAGYVYPSGKPGLGIDVREEAFAKYPYERLHMDIFDKDYSWGKTGL